MTNWNHPYRISPMASFQGIPFRFIPIQPPDSLSHPLAISHQQVSGPFRCSGLPAIRRVIGHFEDSRAMAHLLPRVPLQEAPRSLHAHALGARRTGHPAQDAQVTQGVVVRNLGVGAPQKPVFNPLGWVLCIEIVPCWFYRECITTGHMMTYVLIFCQGLYNANGMCLPSFQQIMELDEGGLED